jgi:hypothetical protein
MNKETELLAEEDSEGLTGKKAPERMGSDLSDAMVLRNKKSNRSKIPGLFREFSSATMLRMLFHDRSTTKDNLAPFSQPVFGAVLFADISGFTRLSASLSAEDLKRRIK